MPEGKASSLYDIFKSGPNFEFKKIDYSSKEGEKILKELKEEKKERKEEHRLARIPPEKPFIVHDFSNSSRYRL